MCKWELQLLVTLNTLCTQFRCGDSNQTDCSWDGTAVPAAADSRTWSAPDSAADCREEEEEHHTEDSSAEGLHCPEVVVAVAAAYSGGEGEPYWAGAEAEQNSRH